MNLLFLGTGTSTGIPQIGCKCKTCVSTDRKDKRFRASVLLSDGETKILIDCGPDIRQQFLAHDVNHISAILLTHEHYDHVGGLDDVRPLGSVKVYGEKQVLETIRRNMYYCFEKNKYPGVPKLQLSEIDTRTFNINNIKIQPIRVMHAQLPILGFRINNIAYLTDVKTISEQAINQLKDLDILIINALRIKEHVAHITLQEALKTAAQIGAKKTYFTHMSHDMGLHEEAAHLLPPNHYFAYDGLSINNSDMTHQNLEVDFKDEFINVDLDNKI
jgi:phosphoribosyl 1,2-cyclic phosphate phosphodiesterase